MLAILTIPYVQKDAQAGPGEQALYGALDAIRHGNAALAERLHEEKGLPLFSAAQEADTIRVGALDDCIVHASIQLPNRACTISCATTFEKLIQEAPASTTLSMRFASPTVFRHGGQPDVALPLPVLIFGSLHRRWLSAGGPVLPELDHNTVGIWQYSLHTERVTFRGHGSPHFTRGFVGHVEYRVPHDYAVWYHALARFAFYSGVGSRTTQGMGQVRPC